MKKPLAQCIIESLNPNKDYGGHIPKFKSHKKWAEGIIFRLQEKPRKK